MDDLKNAEIREEILDIWGRFGVKVLMNSSLIDTMLDEELSLGDAVRPYLKDVFRLTLERIGYRKVIWIHSLRTVF